MKSCTCSRLSLLRPRCIAVTHPTGRRSHRGAQNFFSPGSALVLGGPVLKEMPGGISAPLPVIVHQKPQINWWRNPDASPRYCLSTSVKRELAPFRLLLAFSSSALLLTPLPRGTFPSPPSSCFNCVPEGCSVASSLGVQLHQSGNHSLHWEVT